MTIKKFSLAAILAVGVLAGTMNLSYGTCPLRGCSQPIAPIQKIDDCGCDKAKLDAECPAVSCDEPAIPSCAVCPKGEMPKLDKQVYTYPNDIFGRNQHIGDTPDGMTLGNTAFYDTATTPAINLRNFIVFLPKYRITISILLLK